MAFDVCKLSRLLLGRQGENAATVISIDVSDWLGRWPDATIQLLHLRHDEQTPYDVHAQLTGEYLVWTVSDADTAIQGKGMAEIRAIEGDVLKKSRLIETIVEPAMGGTVGEVPEPLEEWAGKLAESVARAEEALETVEDELQAVGGWSTAEAVAVTLPSGSEATAELTDTEQGKRITFGIPQGEQGQRGEQGKSGVHVGTSEPNDGSTVWIDPSAVNDQVQYTLPVATSDTLGGVKVGAGLQMDGDALGVKPEGVYELIETITVDEATIIERSTEPNGTPYNFRELIIKAKTDAANTTGGSCFAYCGNTIVGKSWWGSVQNSTAERTRKDEYRIEKGYWTSKWVDWSNNIAGQVTVNKKDMYLTYDENTYPAITRLYTAVAVAAGTTIEIWGVRADA